MNIHFLRHAEVLSNANGSLSVSLDETLTDTGQSQAQKCCQELQSVQYDQICCSPLPRALETISYLPERLIQNMQVMPELAEGRLVLGHVPEVKEPSFWDHPQLGLLPVENETSAQFVGRASQARTKILQMENENTLIVSHGHMIRELLNQFLGINDRIRFPHDNCGLTSLTVSENISINYANRVFH